ncbi:glutamate receptor ionotropic, kainate glr-3-like [Periplaneta americana]|uniref:glutamate receptor ionotropic, kainate glr-3-like n=1 Tax=Periplaneta americana TaxID=6978 RepID=UPI0037E78F71
MNMIYLQFTLILFQLALICSALAHDKQLYLLHSFCNQYHRSSMIIFNNLDWWNESRKHNNVQIVKFMSQFYLRITVTFTDMQPSCQIQEDTAGITPLFVLQYSTSPDFQKFLKQCFEEGQFSGKIIWLFFTSSALSPYLFNDLKDLNIRLDSNVLITIQDSEGKGQLMETYNLGQNSNPQYHVVTQWDSKNTSLLLPPQLYKYNKQRRGNLQGYQLRAVAVTVNEFYTQIQKIGNRYEILGGYFAETFKNLADTLNFTYNITYLPGYAYGNTPTDNSSSWSGMIGMMQRHEADLSVCEASITIDRLEVMDFTMAVHTASRKLYIHEGIKELRMDWYFRPFSISTWLALITALFLFTFISTFLHYITHKTKRRTRRAGFLSNFFTIVTIMLQQGTEQPASLSIRLVLQSSAVLFLVVHVAYSAKLTALSTLYKPQPPVSHIRDLLKSSSWKFGIMDGSLPFNIFKAS